MKIFVTLIMFVILLSTSSCTCSNDIYGPMSQWEDSPVLSFSLSPAPKLFETGELSFKNNLRFYTTSGSETQSPKVRVWVEFKYANTKGSYSEAKYAIPISLEEVLVSGQLDWEGNPFDVGDTLELVGIIQLPREGVWEITGYIEAEGFDYAYINTTFVKKIRVAVTEDAAAVMGTREFYNGPLAYLANFGYGQAHKPVPNEFAPVWFEFDVSKAPLVGEEATLTCYIHSFFDLSDFTSQITFMKRTVGNKTRDVSGDNLLVHGVLNWTGNLSKDVPSQFSATIKFPEEGDWWIHVQADYPINDIPAFGANMYIHISRDLSSFGWEDWP